MATYKQIRGTTVQNNAGDYTGAVQGQLWYNSTAGSFQFRNLTTVGSWSTGGALNTARFELGGVGIQTSALAFGGSLPGTTAVTESYNGSAWTEVNDLNTARSALGDAGTSTSALGFSGPPGSTPVQNESWNGTCWTEVADINVFRGDPGGAGSDNTSALMFGGGVPSGPELSALTESWNGTSWTEVADLNIARANQAGTGKLNTAALCVGGSGDPDGTE